MEKTIQLVSGTRQLNLKKSFQLGIRSLLTACSKEDISKAFGCFPKSEQESIHRLFIQVITSLHEKIEDEFESLGLETHVGTVLDTVEQSVEEQRLDALFSDKTDVGDVQRDLSTAKQNEIQYLMSRLQMAEGNKNMMEARVEQLRKEVQDVPVSADVIMKKPEFKLQRMFPVFMKPGPTTKYMNNWKQRRGLWKLDGRKYDLRRAGD